MEYVRGKRSKRFQTMILLESGTALFVGHVVLWLEGYLSERDASPLSGTL
jgi:hypothetical protein